MQSLHITLKSYFIYVAVAKTPGYLNISKGLLKKTFSHANFKVSLNLIVLLLRKLLHFPSHCRSVAITASNVQRILIAVNFVVLCAGRALKSSKSAIRPKIVLAITQLLDRSLLDVEVYAGDLQYIFIHLNLWQAIAAIYQEKIDCTTFTKICYDHFRAEFSHTFRFCFLFLFDNKLFHESNNLMHSLIEIVSVQITTLFASNKMRIRNLRRTK